MDVANDHIQTATLELTVIRADGTVEFIGEVDSYQRRPTWRARIRKALSWRQS